MPTTTSISHVSLTDLSSPGEPCMNDTPKRLSPSILLEYGIVRVSEPTQENILLSGESE